jgi:hypothetical protein
VNTNYEAFCRENFCILLLLHPSKVQYSSQQSIVKGHLSLRAKEPSRICNGLKYAAVSMRGVGVFFLRKQQEKYETTKQGIQRTFRKPYIEMQAVIPTSNATSLLSNGK